MPTTKDRFPRIVYVVTTNYGSDDKNDPWFFETSEDMADVVCKSTKKVAIYKLERIEQFDWNDWIEP